MVSPARSATDAEGEYHLTTASQEAYRRPDHRERIIKLQRWLNQDPQESKNPSPELKAKIRALFKGYRSTMDAPCCDLIPELIATYPNAKFILSVRDTQETWHRSWMESLGYHFGRGMRREVYRALISSVYTMRRMDDLAQEVRFRLVRDWGEIGPQVYEMHNQQVREMVPEGQLLEYNVKQGWGPLCKFLGVDVPDAPFPKLFERDSIKAIYVGQQVFGGVTWASLLGIVGIAFYSAVRPDVTVSVIRSVLRWVGMNI